MMKTAIINQLNNIRLLEHQKLYEKFDLILAGNKNREAIKVPHDMIEQISRRHKEAYSEKNFSTALDNYNKLRDILLFTINIRKKIKFDLLSVSKDPSKIDGFIEKTNKELLDLILKINASVPEQISFKPLAPFFFLNDDIKTIKGKIGIIVLCNNSADHLPDLFDSFLEHNTYENYKFFIIDRNSSDDSVKVIKSYEERLKIEMISDERAYTSSYLNNLTVDTCHSEYLLFLNAKAIFTNDLLPAFQNSLEHSTTSGIIGASIKVKGNAGPENAEHYFGGLKFKYDEIAGLPDIPNPIIDPEFLVESGILLTARGFRNTERTFIPPGLSLPCLKPYPAIHVLTAGLGAVPAVPGFAMFCLRDDFIRAGGFDLNYFNGFEYSDLCMKFARKINKNTALSHDLVMELNTDNVMSEWCIPDPVVEFHNLGVLINQHGYFIKHHYFESLAEGSREWTDDQEMISAEISTAENKKFRIAIKIPAFNNDKATHWGDYHFAHSLKNSFIRKGHYARVDLFDEWYQNGYLTDDVVIVLRGIKNYHVRNSQINIMWNISHPQHVVWDEYTDYDHVFTASESFPHELSEKYNIKAEALLQCTDPDLFHNEFVTGESFEKTDVLYVANSRGVMRKSVDYAMQKNIPVTLFGTNWENIIPPEQIKGQFIPNGELRKYYSGCTVLLNDHWQDMADVGYISNRIFDALACGAVILTDRVKGIEHVFPQGLYYYDTPEEMQEQIQWIRDHYDEAKALAMKNSAEVLEKHNFDKRAERILEVISEIHDRKIAAANPEAEKKTGFFERILEYAGKRF